MKYADLKEGMEVAVDRGDRPPGRAIVLSGSWEYRRYPGPPGHYPAKKLDRRHVPCAVAYRDCWEPDLVAVTKVQGPYAEVRAAYDYVQAQLAEERRIAEERRVGYRKRRLAVVERIIARYPDSELAKELRDLSGSFRPSVPECDVVIPVALMERILDGEREEPHNNPDCGHQCFVIGGPFISHDPNCPIHGRAKE